MNYNLSVYKSVLKDTLLKRKARLVLLLVLLALRLKQPILANQHVLSLISGINTFANYHVLQNTPQALPKDYVYLNVYHLSTQIL